MGLCWIGLHSWKSVLRWSGANWIFDGWRQCAHCRKKKDFDEAVFRATEYFR